MSFSNVTRVSLTEAKDLVKACGTDTTIVMLGEPGVGKSSMCREIGNEMEMPSHVVDCANLDIGDVAIPDLNREEGCTEYLPNKAFGVHEPNPSVVMLDELFKASQPVKNMLLPWILERRLGSRRAHPDSIVFATSNLATDGVGDNLKAHEINRMTMVEVRKPDSEQWCTWAEGAMIDPSVIAWVKDYPHCLDSYRNYDLTNENNRKAAQSNPYIFIPNFTKGAFVSPRSLEKASNIVKRREKINQSTLLSALVGTVGPAAARDMEAYISLTDKLPAHEVIIAQPDQTLVPEDMVSQTILVYRSSQLMKKESFTSLMKYISRLRKEAQALFVAVIRLNQEKKLIAASNPAFTKWCVANQYMF